MLTNAPEYVSEHALALFTHLLFLTIVEFVLWGFGVWGFWVWGCWGFGQIGLFGIGAVALISCSQILPNTPSLFDIMTNFQT